MGKDNMLDEFIRDKDIERKELEKLERAARTKEQERELRRLRLDNADWGMFARAMKIELMELRNQIKDLQK